MDYNRAAVFVRVVKTGSFTAAATELGLPKSSLSRTVSRLEEDLGVRLLHRTTRKLALTEIGQAYYDSVAPTFGTLDDARRSRASTTPSLAGSCASPRPPTRASSPG